MLNDARDRIVLTQLVAATLSADTTVYVVTPPFPCRITDVLLSTSTGNAAHTSTNVYNVQVTAQPANKAIWATAKTTLATTVTIAASTPTSLGAPDQNDLVASNSMLALLLDKQNSAGNLADCYVTVHMVPA